MFITVVCVIFLIKLRWPKSKSLYEQSLYMFPLIFPLHNKVMTREGSRGRDIIASTCGREKTMFCHTRR